MFDVTKPVSQPLWPCDGMQISADHRWRRAHFIELSDPRMRVVPYSVVSRNAI